MLTINYPIYPLYPGELATMFSDAKFNAGIKYVN